MAEPLVPLGEIVATHGLRGWLKLNPFNPETTALKPGAEVFIEQAGTQTPLLLEASNPNKAGFTAQIVAQAPGGIADPEVTAQLQALFSAVDELDGVDVTSPYDNPQQVSQDGTIAFAQLDISDRSQTEAQDLAEEIQDLGEQTVTDPDVRVEYGGDVFAEFELPESEAYGLIAAIIILVVAFGSVLAMGLPIGTALLGLGTASSVVVPDLHSPAVAAANTVVGSAVCSRISPRSG